MIRFEVLGKRYGGRWAVVDLTLSIEPGEVVECAKRLLAEYERIGPDYCRKAGVSFPAEAARIMWQLIGEFERV